MREKQILGIILAGGTSRRFGADKCTARLGNRALLDRVIARARPQVEELVLNANADMAAVFDIERIADDAPGEGPLAGILAGLKLATDRGYSHVASFACDTPFFPHDTVAHLCDALYTSQADVAIARCGPAFHRVFALWTASCRPKLEASFAGGARSMRSVEDSLGFVWANFVPRGGPDGDPFFNINTGVELKKAEDWLSKHSPEDRLQI